MSDPTLMDDWALGGLHGTTTVRPTDDALAAALEGLSAQYDADAENVARENESEPVMVALIVGILQRHARDLRSVLAAHRGTQQPAQPSEPGGGKR